MPTARIVKRGMIHLVVGFSNDWTAATLPGSATLSHDTLLAAAQKPKAIRLKTIHPAVVWKPCIAMFSAPALPIKTKAAIRKAFKAKTKMTPAGSRIRALGKRHSLRKTPSQAVPKMAIREMPSRPEHSGEISTLKRCVPMSRVAGSTTRPETNGLSTACDKRRVIPAARGQRESLMLPAMQASRAATAAHSQRRPPQRTIRSQNTGRINTNPAKVTANAPDANQRTSSRCVPGRSNKAEERRQKTVIEPTCAARNGRLIGEPANSAEIASSAGLYFSQATVTNSAAKPTTTRHAQGAKALT